jgi:hypothetical protein
MGNEAVKTPSGKPPSGKTQSGKKPGGRNASKGSGLPSAGQPKAGQHGAVRRPSAAVYRRRRQFAGGALLLVVGLTAGGIATVSGALNPSSEQASSTETGGSADPGGQPSPSATPSATASPTCDQKLVTVTAGTNKAAYGPDEKPVLTLKVANGGKLPCKVNIGTSQMEFLVTSGSDRVFSSKDCQAESDDLVRTIAPGKSETANFPWPRNRSVQGCEEIPDGVGAGYYVFIAKLGPKVSPPAVFQLG